MNHTLGDTQSSQTDVPQTRPQSQDAERQEKSFSQHDGTGSGEKEKQVTETEQEVTASSDALDTHQQTTKDFGFLPIPRHLRYDPAKPFHFGIVLNMAFGFASTFIVANLYYCQPILVNLSIAFNVSYSEVSRIPTLVQAGYATGLLLISPLGDLVRRRLLILTIVMLSASLTIGLAITRNLAVFEALSFVVGAVSVTPQILIPLAADLAPPERRGTAIAVVLAGLLFGVLIARVLAGIIAEVADYRVVYYFAIGVNYLVLVGAYWLLPDYPRKNKDLSYFDILWSMAKYAVTEPQLIQACLLNMLSSACFSNFWVTLTFLLSGPPYHYSTLVIGLFGLVGMFGVAMGPLVGRFVDMLIPWYATLVAITGQMVFQAVEVSAGGINIAAVVLACIGLDVFRQIQQVSQSSSVMSISVAARARLNAVFVISIFIGQVMGTSVGTKVFLEHGWRAGAGLALGWMGLMMLFLFLRGPNVDIKTWVGWQGGFGNPRRKKTKDGL